MTEKQYAELVAQMQPPSPMGKDCVNAFVIGPVTTTWYQMLFTSKEGTFGVLLMANLVGRITTKPWVIAACTVLTWMVHRAVYRPVIRRIVGSQAA